MQLNHCLPFEPHEPHVIVAKYDMYLHLFIFTTWIKIPDGYQMVELVSFMRSVRRMYSQSTVPVVFGGVT